MQIVSKLAHKLEDVFEALEENRIPERQTALQLATLAVEELENLINLEINDDLEADQTANLELIAALEEFLQTVENADHSSEIGVASNDFIQTALTVELDACLKRVEEILADSGAATPKNISQALKLLGEECTLLGQALSCCWLVDIAREITNLQQANRIEVSKLAEIAITEIKQLRTQFLDGQDKENYTFSEAFSQLLPQQKTETKPEEKEDKPQLQPSEPSSPNLRIPVERVTRMSDTVGELLIYHQRLQLYENQLKQASLNLKKRTQALFPLKEQVEYVYDQLTITENQEVTLNSAQKHSDLEEFDPLEFDQYTQVHTTLQSLSELMVQVQEVREDVDLLSREFTETLLTMRQSLDNLDQDLTQVRLVPFATLAGGFINPIEKLNKRYSKSVEFVIVGEQVLIDKAILETLRTPFTHIIRNAFAHGIESPETRKKAGKPTTGKIKLAAKLQGNHLVINIADDGNGINIDKVYQKAASLGLFPQNISSRTQLTKEQILDFIFSPGFSTARKISDLSGRGMGMDIVRAEIEKLRGTIKVKTETGKGTLFTIRIPLALNIIPLLLVRCQQQKLAIPSDSVLRIIRLGDYPIKNNKVLWQKELIPLYPLFKILPYNSPAVFDYSPDFPTPNLGLLLKIGGQKIFLAVDAIADEQELVVKGFDDTVKIPAYVAGCTVLATGEVVPILVPDYLKQLLITWEQKPVAIEAPPETAKSSEGASILVIDDSIAVRRTLERILTQAGYKVVPCRDGKEGWNVLQTANQKFNLAICDLEMPGLDGYKVLQLIRSSHLWQDLPVIMLTSRENDLHRQKAMNLGANAYMTKPFHPLAMLETIKDQLTEIEMSGLISAKV
jgi:type IV pili sensor histidine kinase/response regulator